MPPVVVAKKKFSLLDRAAVRELTDGLPRRAGDAHTRAIFGAAADAVRSGAVMTARPPREEHGFMIPLPPFEMPPKKKVHFIVHSEVEFRLERIIIPDTIAPSFSIHDIVIGELSQMSQIAEVPASMFAPMAIGINLQMQLQKEQPFIDVVVRNTTDAPAVFMMVLAGTTFGEPFQLSTRDVDDARYHAWAVKRQGLYESVYRGDDEMTVFNGQEIFADTFTPKTNMWWVDGEGYKVRPVYHFEDIAMKQKRGGLQAVDVTTYDGFE